MDDMRDKFKSHLVGHGNEQDLMLYLNCPSPTMQIHSIMTCIGIVAGNRQYAVAKLDVKVAFIQTELSGMPIYVKCMGRLKNLTVHALPEIRQYIASDGALYCKLKNVLNGSVQASMLWLVP